MTYLIQSAIIPCKLSYLRNKERHPIVSYFPYLKEQMKIAYIGQKGIPASYGGVEKHVEEIATRLANNPENKVYVYCRKWYVKDNKNYKLVINNLRRVFTPSIKTKHLDTITHVFTSTIHALFQSYDIIHYQGIGPSLLSFIPRIFRPDIKVFATYHCADYDHGKWGQVARFFLRLGEKTCLTFPHKTIVVSQNMKTYLEERYNKKIQYIPNGINAYQKSKAPVEILKISKNQKSQPKAGRSLTETVLNQYGLKKNQYFLTVNRLVRHKGVHYLIEAYQSLYSNPSVNDMKLVIVGDSAFTNDYVIECKALAYGNPNIVFTGYQTGKTLEELYKNTYLYIQPSQSEGMAIVLLEAMSHGKAVLASDIEANLETVKQNGLTFPNGDVKKLKLKLKYSIRERQKLRLLGMKSQKWVNKNYNWNTISSETFNLYQN